MSARANIVNRVVLTVLGLLLLAVGGLGLALSLGVFGARPATYPILPGMVSTFPDGRPWFWWAVAALLLLIAVLALLWLVTQFTTDRTTRLDRTTDARDGRTILHTGALAHAVEDEAIGTAGVTGASAHVEEHPREHLTLRVELADSADVEAVRERLENEVVTHLREAVGDPRFPVSIELRPNATGGSRRTPA